MVLMVAVSNRHTTIGYSPDSCQAIVMITVRDDATDAMKTQFERQMYDTGFELTQHGYESGIDDWEDKYGEPLIIKSFWGIWARLETETGKSQP
jgi:hypothetical protein